MKNQHNITYQLTENDMNEDQMEVATAIHGAVTKNKPEDYGHDLESLLEVDCNETQWEENEAGKPLSLTTEDLMDNVLIDAIWLSLYGHINHDTNTLLDSCRSGFEFDMEDQCGTVYGTVTVLPIAMTK